MSRFIQTVGSILAFLVLSACTDPSGSDTSRVAEPVSALGPSAMRIVIDPNGDVRIDGEAVDTQTMRARMESLHATNPDWTLVLGADPASPDSVFRDVLDAASEIGVGSIAIVAGEQP